MAVRCHNCKHYQESEEGRYLGECTNEDVNIHDERDVDSEGVFADRSNIKVGMNFGCIHFEEAEEYPFEEEDDYL